jgi:hypothetical protein
MASFLFHLRLFDEEWKVVECRIAVSNQHGYVAPHPRQPVPDLARPTSPETVASLVDL